jgi:hypothetical protein
MLKTRFKVKIKLGYAQLFANSPQGNGGICLRFCSLCYCSWHPQAVGSRLVSPSTAVGFTAEDVRQVREAVPWAVAAYAASSESKVEKNRTPTDVLGNLFFSPTCFDQSSNVF